MFKQQRDSIETKLAEVVEVRVDDRALDRLKETIPDMKAVKRAHPVEGRYCIISEKTRCRKS